LAITSLTFMWKLRAAAAHPDAQGEVVVMAAGQELLGGAHDEVLLLIGEEPWRWLTTAAACLRTATR